MTNVWNNEIENEQKEGRKKGKRDRVGNTYAVKEALLSVWQMATLFKRECVTGFKVASNRVSCPILTLQTGTIYDGGKGGGQCTVNGGEEGRWVGACYNSG